MVWPIEAVNRFEEALVETLKQNLKDPNITVTEVSNPCWFGFLHFNRAVKLVANDGRLIFVHLTPNPDIVPITNLVGNQERQNKVRLSDTRVHIYPVGRVREDKGAQEFDKFSLDIIEWGPLTEHFNSYLKARHNMLFTPTTGRPVNLDELLEQTIKAVKLTLESNTPITKERLDAADVTFAEVSTGTASLCRAANGVNSNFWKVPGNDVAEQNEQKDETLKPGSH